MNQRVRLAVAGAGAIGKRHVDAIAASPHTELHSVTDPDQTVRDYASSLGVPWYPCLEELFETSRPDGIIIATPNQVHLEHALACIAAGVPALIEKPLAISVADARKIAEAGEAAGIPLMVGHHRRHNPLITLAKERLNRRVLGDIVAVQAMFWLKKPDSYFDIEWRRQPGAGPVLLNLIHDIDLLRFLIGEVAMVHALESHSVRKNAVEDSAAVLLRFANGALCTISLSDTVVAPWSWELTSGENPAYPPTGQSCYFIGGTLGAMELPNMRVWSYTGKQGWREPISATTYPAHSEDPLVRQATQFARVILGEETPLVPACEGLKTLEVIEAVKRSAATSRTVHLK